MSDKRKKNNEIEMSKSQNVSFTKLKEICLQRANRVTKENKKMSAINFHFTAFPQDIFLLQEARRYE